MLGNSSRSGLEQGTKVVLFWRQEEHCPAGLLIDLHSKWQSLYSLFCSQWLGRCMGEARLSPGSCCLLQASYMVSCMTLRSEQCKARPEQVAGQGWGCVSYLEVAELGFYLLALVKKSWILYNLQNVFRALLCSHIPSSYKNTIFLWKVEGQSPLLSHNEALMETTQDMWSHETNLPGQHFGISGLEIWISPGKILSLFEKVREK